MSHTPTTESVRCAFIADGGWTAEDRSAMFDRWHQEELRKAKEAAWGQGVTESGLDLDYILQLLDNNPYRSQP